MDRTQMAVERMLAALDAPAYDLGVLSELLVISYRHHRLLEHRGCAGENRQGRPDDA